MEPLLLVSAFVVLAYAMISAVIPKTLLTAPLCFVAAGVLLSEILTSSVELDLAKLIEKVAELTLVILLFTDASRIDARVLTRELGYPVRLLGIGMPLTIALGTLAAWWIFPELTVWEGALLAAILAPTDAALGQAVVSSSRVPQRIRQALNVESGLNDGIAVPIVLLFASLAANTPASDSVTHWVFFWAKQVTLGPVVGVAVGAIGGKLLDFAAAKGWVMDTFMQLSGIALAILAWSIATVVDGNAFIAAFTAGLAIASMTQSVKPVIQDFADTEGQLLSLVTFMLFGAVLVVPAFQSAGWSDWLYAILSLTAIRMIPVAISLIGTKVHPSTVLFMGWFGPRGLASVIFALLVTSKNSFPHGESLFNVAILTATCSVVVHGMTSLPGAALYSRIIQAEAHQERFEHHEVTEHPLRHRVA
ncbi:sodium:proton antiporter [Novipirellula caenicola]|uniref:K(+)/H(+) antiporter NhaP n=1 Tax=Novipirellula caenicola TaxID=1536901 RepID=A0ABP9VKP9_9BACT